MAMKDIRYTNTMPKDTSTTTLLGEHRKGDKEAEAQLIERMYKELHRLAHNYMRKERPGHILQTTALVNEAYIRLAGGQRIDFKNRSHFLAVAANTMRRVLVDLARQRDSGKRRVQMISLEDAFAYTDEQSWQVGAIDEALTRLEEWDPRQAKIVEFRLFAGFTTDEIAKLMELSESTIKSEYRLAKSWLYDQLTREIEKTGAQ